MKLNIKSLLSLMLYIAIGSCVSKSPSKFESSVAQYQNEVDCLNQNYQLITKLVDFKGSGILLSPSEIKKYKLCESMLKLLQRDSIEYLYYYKDSTIEFYQKGSDGILAKQNILMFADKKEKIDGKIGSDVEIVRKVHNGYWCYELIKSIGLAD